MQRARRVPLALLGIGLQQVIDIGLEDAVLRHPDRLWQTARKHIAAKALAGHELRRRIAHGVEALQPEGEQRGKFFARGLTLFGRLGRQQQF